MTAARSIKCRSHQRTKEAWSPSPVRRSEEHNFVESVGEGSTSSAVT